MLIPIPPTKARFNSKQPSISLNVVLTQDDLEKSCQFYWQLLDAQGHMEDSGNILVQGPEYQSLDRTIPGILQYIGDCLNLPLGLAKNTQPIESEWALQINEI